MRQLFLILLLLFFTNAYSQSGVRNHHFNIEGGVAIQGYDPVAYFTQNKAVEGSEKYTATVEGITYSFSSAANKDIFLKEPKKYEPEYGGWCAYAMGANNDKVEIDPETFKIVIYICSIIPGSTIPLLNGMKIKLT